MSSVAQVEKKSTIALRIPHEARDWLQSKAKSSCRTMSGQILFMIEKERQQEEQNNECTN